MRKSLYLIIPLLLFISAAPSCRENVVNNMPNNVRSNQQNTNSNAANAAASPSATTTATPAAANVPPPVYTYEIVNTFKHDSDAFTEGLFFYNGFLYESVGRENKSDLRKTDLKTGDIKQRRKMEEQYFGEGTTALNGKIYQLTWEDEKAFVYDLNTFEPLSLLAYSGEGWGLTNDGTNLIMSNGSHQIKFLNPETFQVIRTISVFNNGIPLKNINELEYIKGEIWANIWHSEEPQQLGKPNYIARLDPQDGKILGWVDLGNISPEDVKRDQENTLNGIAYDAAADRIFVTGKQWKKLFEIKVKPKA